MTAHQNDTSGKREAPARRIRWLALLGGVCALCALAGGYGYATLSPGLVQSMTARFGEAARGRLNAWAQFARGQAGGAPAAQMSAVNAFLNRIPWMSDNEHWGAADYWATPAETVASHGADCEDFAIAKYFLLKELGVPIRQLRITYVRAARINEPHMVLAWYPRPDAEPLIFDNLEPRVLPASARKDLTPVYSFNDEDVMLEAQARFGGDKAAAAAGAKGSVAQVRLWRQLNERLAAEAKL